MKSAADKIKTLNNKPCDCDNKIDCLSLLLRYKPGNVERETRVLLNNEMKIRYNRCHRPDFLHFNIIFF